MLLLVSVLCASLFKSDIKTYASVWRKLDLKTKKYETAQPRNEDGPSDAVEEGPILCQMDSIRGKTNSVDHEGPDDDQGRVSYKPEDKYYCLEYLIVIWKGQENKV